MTAKKKAKGKSSRSKKAKTDANGSKLLIVESPAKARTVGRYLDDSYVVKASVGHVCDLPKRELGVDIENGFEPHYVTIRGKGKVIKELKQAAKGAEIVFLATDPDREGEAIAYHVADQLGYRSKNGRRFKRVLFEEITPEGVAQGLESPGEIDFRKVDAQQARRVLDRLVGYKASPFLWKPIRPGLSAGRVQTVTLRLIWEREEAIRRFEPREYWTIEALLEKEATRFTAKLHHLDGKKPISVGIDVGLTSDASAVTIAQQQGDKVAVKTRVWQNPHQPETVAHKDWRMPLDELVQYLRDLRKLYPAPAVRVDGISQPGPAYVYDKWGLAGTELALEQERGYSLIPVPQQGGSAVLMEVHDPVSVVIVELVIPCSLDCRYLIRQCLHIYPAYQSIFTSRPG